MKTIAIVQNIILKTIPSGNNKCYYNHLLVFEDGTNGNLKGCTDPNPVWLRKGIKLECDIQPSMYGNFIIPIKVNGKPIQEDLSKLLHPAFQEKPQWKGSQRIEDIPEYWLKKQKCITILSCLDRATELVSAGKIQLKDLHKCAIKNFDMVMEQSKME